MNIQKITKDKLRNISKENLIEALEYQSFKRGLRTLTDFLEHKSLYTWIYSGHYDFKYTAIEFIKKLAIIFDIDQKEILLEIEESKILYNEVNSYCNSYIFVNTDFKRTTQPIFALCVSEGQRNIRLEKEDLVFKSKKEVLQIISSTVLNHYKESAGEIGIWGKIKRYTYHHKDGQIYVFNCNGELIKDSANIVESRAVITIKGKELICGQMN